MVKTIMKYIYTCEVCGRKAVLSQEEAYAEGWDYPPFMGQYGIVSPRTCPDCPMMETAWAALMLKKKSYDELTNKQREAIMRIQGEPGNMIPANGDKTQNTDL